MTKKRKPKRSSGRVQYSFPGDPDVMSDLVEFAIDDGVSMSAIIRQAVRQYRDNRLRQK